MKERRAVITGGAGFIGSNLAEELAKENEVIILDDFSTGKIENISSLSPMPNVRIIRNSILNLGVLQELFEGIDYVFHLAADPNVAGSIEDPLRTNEVNLTGTLNVLIAGRDRKVRKVIYASSSAVYGDGSIPNVETMNPNPTSPYALTKLTGEYYCKLFSKIYSSPTIALRYFNVYGPKQDSESEYAAVIPKFIKRVLNSEAPVIYGDGEQTRDFIFVKDVVRATILAAEEEINSEALNIAAGREISINDLARKIATISGENLKPIYVEPLPGDVKYSLADVSKAKELLDFRPTCSLEDGLLETLKYFSKQSGESE